MSSSDLLSLIFLLLLYATDIIFLFTLEEVMVEASLSEDRGGCCASSSKSHFGLDFSSFKQKTIKNTAEIANEAL